MPHSVSALIFHFIVAVLSAGGYLGVIGLMAIESACVPLPSEIILPLAGYLVSQGQMNLLLVATAGALGCNLGSIPVYELASRGGRRAVLRWGRYILLTEADLIRAERFFDRFGSMAVFLARLLPLVRSFIAFPAGIARMPRGRFHLYTFAGSWLWSLLLAWLGMKLGSNWATDSRLQHAFRYADYALVALAILATARFAWVRRQSR